MSFFSFIKDAMSAFSGDSASSTSSSSMFEQNHGTINPASGLPMHGSFDIMGNPFGQDYSGSGSSFDSFGSSGSSGYFGSSGSFGSGGMFD